MGIKARKEDMGYVISKKYLTCRGAPDVITSGSMAFPKMPKPPRSAPPHWFISSSSL